MSLLCALAVCVLFPSDDAAIEADYVLRGATLYDGTGAAGVQVDLAIKGDEQVSIRGVADIRPRQVMNIEITRADGTKIDVPALLRIDTLDELEYFRHGGILHYVLRNLVKQAA